MDLLGETRLPSFTENNVDKTRVCVLQTFEELMELAVNGNAHNVDIYTDEFVKYAKSEAKDEDSMYTAAMKQAELLSNVIYGFWKCPGKKISKLTWKMKR